MTASAPAVAAEPTSDDPEKIAIPIDGQPERISRTSARPSSVPTWMSRRTAPMSFSPRVLERVRLEHGVTLQLEVDLAEEPDRRLVVDDEYGVAAPHTAGSVAPVPECQERTRTALDVAARERGPFEATTRQARRDPASRRRMRYVRRRSAGSACAFRSQP